MGKVCASASKITRT